MSLVMAIPPTLEAAATDLARLGAVIMTAREASAAATSEVVAAGGEEVSAPVADFFSGHARAYQQLSAGAAEFHDQFVRVLTAAAGAYVATEAASVNPL